MGGVVAFELVRRLEAAGAGPRALVVGAVAPPNRPRGEPPIYALPEQRFLDALHTRYGTSRALFASPDLRELIVPSLRGDLEAFETYLPGALAPIATPITVLRASRDPRTSADDLERWNELTSAGATMHAVDDGHFFVASSKAWVLERLTAVLAQP
jgi:surfactin synthase thioesterase subunit